MKMYKCDRCGDKIDVPDKHTVTIQEEHFQGTEIIGKGSMDLCSDCYEELKELIEDFMDSDNK